MYRPVVKLNINICRICDKRFENEKCLKDYIFNIRLDDIKKEL